jgi:spoIIIJ-associated protein
MGQPPAELPSDPANRVRAVVERIASALDPQAQVVVEEDDQEIRATVEVADAGTLIGRHGATIDAVQYIASRAAFSGRGDRKSVVVDADGYRARRESTLRRAADRAVEDALSFGRPVELEPMSAPERKIVHQYLAERTDVETYSEGEEPERRLVITPVRASA